MPPPGAHPSASTATTRTRRAGLRLLEEATVRVEHLHDDPGNANIHDERNLQAIQESLKRFGQPERLIVRKRDHRVFVGNGRLDVMRRLGWETARVQFVEGGDAACRAYAIAANRTTRLSRFDDDALAAALKTLNQLDTGLVAAAGYAQDELDDLLRQLGDDDPPEPPPVDVGDVTASATCPSCGTRFRLGGV